MLKTDLENTQETPEVEEKTSEEPAQQTNQYGQALVVPTFMDNFRRQISNFTKKISTMFEEAKKNISALIEKRNSKQKRGFKPLFILLKHKNKVKQ